MDTKKERQRLYGQRPEVQERKSLYNKERNQRPEIIARRKEYQKTYKRKSKPIIDLT